MRSSWESSQLEEIQYRYLSKEDIDQLVHIEKQSFSLPWTEDAFLNEFTINPYAFYLGLEVDGKLIGYAGYWCIMDSAQITNIAVLPEYRGKKLGEQLLKQVLINAKEKGAEQLSLEVRVSNHIAQSLYRKLGFIDGGIRKKYYSDNQEDALVMWVKL